MMKKDILKQLFERAKEKGWCVDNDLIDLITVCVNVGILLGKNEAKLNEIINEIKHLIKG